MAFSIRNLLASLLSAVLLSAFAGTSPVSGLRAQAFAAENWSSLAAYVGKYPGETDLLSKSVIAAPLKKLLGKKHKAFLYNIGTQTPLDQAGNVYFFSGNAAHQGGVEGAYLLVDVQTQALEVGLWQNSKLQVFKTGPAIAKPQDIVSMIDIYAE